MYSVCEIEHLVIWIVLVERNLDAFQLTHDIDHILRRKFDFLRLTQSCRTNFRFRKLIRAETRDALFAEISGSRRLAIDAREAIVGVQRRDERRDTRRRKQSIKSGDG